MDTFENKLQLLFTVGGESFFRKGAVTDYDETFYMHCLRCYVQKIARTTFSDHLLGVGLFAMQGYESRNKQTKRAF